MFSPHKYLYPCVVLFIIYSQQCISELMLGTSLVLYSPGEPEYMDVLVRRVNDNLTLICELRGETTHRSYVWNFVPSNQTLAGPGVFQDRPFHVSPPGPWSASTLHRSELQVTDSGHYMCSVPPHSVTKYISVQNKGPVPCARGAFTCGARCVLGSYVCDGRADCARAEDEAAHMCGPRLCERTDKLNCSSGRCISAAACCRPGSALCQQPACCDEYSRQPVDGGGLIEAEFPPLFEDRRAPDDYGFIQSTIYTVTACALIFMIAVVLLVSAICKMQMKRAALRGYTHADRAASHHYTVQYHQAHSFPPCYEASRLLEQDGVPSPTRSPAHGVDLDAQHVSSPEPSSEVQPRGLARLSAIFSSRYRQVPRHPDVELTSVASSAPPSPLHSPLPLEYRSPCLDSDLYTAEEMGRELNYMAAPVEFFRRRTMRRNTLERVMDQLDRQRLTLQLGRFQLSIPRLGRTEPRPDTPVAEPRATLHSLRIDARDTYTLNGRTIRLLGADIQHTVGSPPSYTEAVRYKLYGPPPEYLSREGLNRQSTEAVDQDAANNVEMPPRYDDLNGNSGEVGGNGREVGGNSGEVGGNSGEVGGNNSEIGRNNSEVDGNSREVGEVGGNTSGIGGNNLGVGVIDVDVSENVVNNRIVDDYINNACSLLSNTNNNETNDSSVAVNNDFVNGNEIIETDDKTNGNVTDLPLTHASQNGRSEPSNLSMSNVETLSSIIDNLPAIDSDVNANDSETGVNNDHVIRDVIDVAN